MGELTQDPNSIATQTEDQEQDPITAKCQQLSYILIQELALHNSLPRAVKDKVYQSLSSCICEMLVKHDILLSGMARRCDVTTYNVFTCIANEIFEATEGGDFTVTWGRIISLFAFAIRLGQEYKDDAEQVDAITRYLSTYLTSHLVPFIKSQGGWDNLVEHYPPPADEDAQVRRAILWSGLCVGLMATMYLSSFLSSR